MTAPVKLIMATAGVSSEAQPGELWAWGKPNAAGQLGLGDTTNRVSPVQVGSLTTWADISVVYDAAGGIASDGTLWTWGGSSSFTYGCSGHGNTTTYSSPVQVGSLTDWATLRGGKNNFWALKTDGTLWAWGAGGNGRLGNGATANKSSPIQVGSLTDWSQILGGQGAGTAIKSDGTLWSIGGHYRYTGTNGGGNHSSPVQIGSLNTWATLAEYAYNAHLVVKTDGTLWCWGMGAGGKLGLGNTTNYSSPVQVGSLTDWKKPFSGRHHSGAIKTDGTLWMWGVNTTGALGIGNTTDNSSPVQVGSLTDWAHAVARKNFTIALKTNGTLWAWGGNYGWLPFGAHDPFVHYSSPVQVGSLTTWQKTDASTAGFGFGIKIP